jgi:putative nucleotidyltransferase-like protein
MLSLHEQSHLLLDLVKSVIDDDSVSQSDSLKDILPSAERNDVYFYVLSVLCSQPDAGHVVDRLASEYAALDERRRYAEREAVRISEFFASRDLPVFFIKDFMRYPYTDHDVDFVVVETPSLPAYRTAMSDLAYQYRFGKSQIREPDKYFYYPLQAEDRFKDIRFHLHKALSWNGVVFLNAQEVLGRCRQEHRESGSLSVPGFEDEILIMAAHAIFENASIHLGEILQFGLLVRDEMVDWDRLIDVATRHNWQMALAFFLDVVWTVLADTGRIKRPDRMHEWVVQTLSEAGISGRETYDGLEFPYEIPYRKCMKLYTDKMLRDIRGSCLSTKAYFWESLSFLVFVWLTRAKKRLA